MIADSRDQFYVCESVPFIQKERARNVRAAAGTYGFPSRRAAVLV